MAGTGSQTTNLARWGDYTVTVSPTSTYGGIVNLSSREGTFSPTALTFAPPEAPPQTATLTIDTTVSGPRTIMVTAADGSTSQTASASLNVTPPTTADFTVSASPASRQVNGARSASYTITVASKDGFSGTVNLAAGNQAGVTAGMNPASVTLASGGSKTSTLTASASAPSTYTVTVTATSASTGVSRTVSVTFRRMK
jgi:hypothetical protein